ncbi:MULTISPECIES: MFS transporter [Pseudomonas]|uniref:MFS transporter n=1 Tax=Pseudomonas TaxID=286 RepID=UPI0002885FB5|nr:MULTISPECIES: MFS transporter [Pseudomonas]AMB79177.1 MFS transporter [Pseudomonas fragi]MCB1654939.1 MFS transporter [Pseudomonadales bacterium]NBF14903.1 MFS transporter [Pseudomonas sp. Fl4BN2]MCH4869999.1 MFS transporter [Pseudomonas sp. TMW22089]NBG92068.1 MFS transporter [Pseudomonas sp. 9.1(2019)]
MAAAQHNTERLPMGALLALAMTGFICIVTETLPAGLLAQISSGLQVSSSLAGQMVTVYALGSLLAAIPLTIATQGWRRRNVLLLTIVGFLLFNSITAWSSSYGVTLVARFFAGASAGLAWSLLAGYARRMVAPHLQGRAMAVAMVGTPIALSLGVPLGTWLGAMVGWRTAFGLMSGLTLVLMVWVLVKVPDYPGQSASQRTGLRQVLLTPGVRSVLGVVMTWMLAHNILYTYIAPFVAPAGLGNDVDIVLLVFGLAALVGIWLTGRLVDRHLRKAVLASLGTFAAIALVFGFFAQSVAVIYTGVLVWGLSFGGAATLLQTALADSAGEGADVALSLNVVVWNSAIAIGALTGGVLLDQVGVGIFPWVLLVLLLAGLWIVFSARNHGFPEGQRQLPDLS